MIPHVEAVRVASIPARDRPVVTHVSSHEALADLIRGHIVKVNGEKKVVSSITYGFVCGKPSRIHLVSSEGDLSRTYAPIQYEALDVRAVEITRAGNLKYSGNAHKHILAEGTAYLASLELIREARL